MKARSAHQRLVRIEIIWVSSFSLMNSNSLTTWLSCARPIDPTHQPNSATLVGVQPKCFLRPWHQSRATGQTKLSHKRWIIWHHSDHPFICKGRWQAQLGSASKWPNQGLPPGFAKALVFFSHLDNARKQFGGIQQADLRLGSVVRSQRTRGPWRIRLWRNWHHHRHTASRLQLRGGQHPRAQQYRLTARAVNDGGLYAHFARAAIQNQQAIAKL